MTVRPSTIDRGSCVTYEGMPCVVVWATRSGADLCTRYGGVLTSFEDVPYSDLTPDPAKPEPTWAVAIWPDASDHEANVWGFGATQPDALQAAARALDAVGLDYLDARETYRGRAWLHPRWRETDHGEEVVGADASVPLVASHVVGGWRVEVEP